MRKRAEFKDAHGTDVKVGDRVRALWPNPRLGEGTVTALNGNPREKPFVVDVDGAGERFFNPEWTEVIDA